MTPVRHIFWDWNGTLLDDAWLCRDVMNGMLRKRGMPEMSAARYQEIFDFPILSYYERIGFDFETETFEVLGMEFIETYERRRREASLYGDVEESLARVRDLGLGQSILSAYHHRTLSTLVEEHGLNPFFRSLHGHDHIYPADKAPQGRIAMAELGIDPAEAVLIGDTSHDVEVAAALGMRCVLIPGGNQLESRLRGLGVPCAVDRREALAWLFA